MKVKEIKHLTRLSDLTIDEILEILQVANRLANGETTCSLSGGVVANLFFEPSTRAQTSSVQKGETLYDTVKTFEAIGVDAVVIRHPQNNYFDELIGKIDIPILNGGDGSGNHPTQSLLDLLTIYQEYGRFEGLKIAIVGDIAHSRVAHTNIEVMTRLGMDVHLVAPAQFQEPGYDWEELDKVLEDMDIVMLLRVQHERHDGTMVLTKDEYHQKYGLTVEREKRMKEGAIIMHPAPFNRGVEIADEVVECNRSRIFKQMSNGVFIRMACLHRSLKNKKH